MISRFVVCSSASLVLFSFLIPALLTGCGVAYTIIKSESKFDKLAVADDQGRGSLKKSAGRTESSGMTAACWCGNIP
jgi:hypothetical protein